MHTQAGKAALTHALKHLAGSGIEPSAVVMNMGIWCRDGHSVGEQREVGNWVLLIVWVVVMYNLSRTMMKMLRSSMLTTRRTLMAMTMMTMTVAARLMTIIILMTPKQP